MPKHKKRPPDQLPGDDAETRTLIDWLKQHDVPFVRCSRYHLKVRHLNYYLGKGTMFYDGEQAAEEERGVDAFKEHLHRLSFSKTGGSSDFGLNTVH